MQRWLSYITCGLVLLCGLTASAQVPLITYQGRLQTNGVPANGQHYLHYKLFDAETGGNLLFMHTLPIQVTNGAFSALLPLVLADFTGADRWLELWMSPDNVEGNLVMISPRQQLTATPYALYAHRTSWSGILNMPAGFADGFDDDTRYNSEDGILQTGTTFSLADLGVTTGKLANLAVTEGKLQALAVTTTKLGNLAVTSDKLADRAVTTIKIADNAVTGAKIANGTLAAADFPANTFWQTNGNAGTTAGTHYLGTTDNQPLDFKVYSRRALRLFVSSQFATPSLIGGSDANTITAGVSGGVIGGGGEANMTNRVTDNFGVVAGGVNNQAGDGLGTVSDRLHAAVGGGYGNLASGSYAVVPGGQLNIAAGSSSFAAGSHAKANHDGTFVWADSSGLDFASTASNQFLIRAINGVGINCADPTVALDVDGILRSRTGGFRFPDGNLLGTTVIIGDVTGMLPSLTIAPGVVTNGKLADGAVTTGKIADNSITSEKIADGAIHSMDISNGEIHPEHLADGTCITEIRDDDGTGSQLDADFLDGHDTSYFSAATHQHGDAYWKVGGNTLADVGIFGALNNQPLEFRINGYQVMRFDLNLGSPRITAGYSTNYIYPNAPGGTISGGGSYDHEQLVTDSYGTIGGGGHNHAGDNAGTHTDRPYATVGGGYYNWATGSYSTIPGGNSNVAAGSYSFAAGHKAQANHVGSFVWGDSTDAAIASTGTNQFVVRAGGGIWLGTAGPVSIVGGRFINTSTGGYLSSGGAWTNSSDRNLKTDFAPIDGRTLLRAVATLPISTWRYKAETGVRHLGPTAQDFRAAFGLGSDERSIATIDSDGVALAAIQALYRQVTDENAALRKQVDTLQQRLSRLEDLEARLAALEKAQPAAGAGMKP